MGPEGAPTQNRALPEINRVKMVLKLLGAHSSGWLERIPDKDEVPGSNPGGPTEPTILAPSASKLPWT